MHCRHIRATTHHTEAKQSITKAVNIDGRGRHPASADCQILKLYKAQFRTPIYTFSLPCTLPYTHTHSTRTLTPTTVLPCSDAFSTDNQQKPVALSPLNRLNNSRPQFVCGDRMRLTTLLLRRLAKHFRSLSSVCVRICT